MAEYNWGARPEFNQALADWLYNQQGSVYTGGGFGQGQFGAWKSGQSGQTQDAINQWLAQNDPNSGGQLQYQMQGSPTVSDWGQNAEYNQQLYGQMQEMGLPYMGGGFGQGQFQEYMSRLPEQQRNQLTQWMQQNPAQQTQPPITELPQMPGDAPGITEWGQRPELNQQLHQFIQEQGITNAPTAYGGGQFQQWADQLKQTNPDQYSSIQNWIAENDPNVGRDWGYNWDQNQSIDQFFQGINNPYTGGFGEGQFQSWLQQQSPEVQQQFAQHQSGGTGGQTPAPTGQPTPNTGNQIDPNNVTQLVGDLVNNPSLPPGTMMQSQLLQNTADQEMQAGNYQVDPSGAQIDPNAVDTNLQADQVTGDAAAATQAGQAAGQGQYDATQLDPNDIVGSVPELATMRGQLEEIMDFAPGTYPDWAKGAVRNAMAEMASRGLTSSTMMGEVMASAMFSAALPIAQHDAKVYENLNLTNIANRAAFMMSNQASSNAAKQFNATSELQTNQFMDQLRNTTKQFNSQQVNAMKMYNENAKLAIEQFNGQMKNARETFNMQNRTAIDQANVQWRRTINTANTATANADHQTNAQNTLNLSNWAMASMWQEYRDNASWAWQSGENEQIRAHNLTLAAMQNDAIFDEIDDTRKNRIYETLGNFAFNLLAGG